MNDERSWMDKINKNILLSSRSSYFSILFKEQKKDTKEDHTLIDKKLQTIFLPKQIHLFFGLSQLTQNTGFLLCFLYERPDIFAKITKQSQKKHFFAHLIQIVIPSFFGFFSSHEHLHNAFRFYRTVIGAGDIDFVKKVVKPFFLSAPMHRFVESTLVPCIDSLLFFVFTSRSFSNDDIIEFYSKMILEKIKTTTSLIPEQHKNILKHIRDDGWKFSEQWNVLWNGCLLPLFNSFVTSSPLSSYEKSFKRIFQKIEERKEEVYKIIADTPSSFTIPSIAAVESSPIVQVFITLGDVVNIAQLIAQDKMMPDTLSPDEFTRFNGDMLFSHFWCTVYSRFPTKTSTTQQFEINECVLSKEASFKFLEVYITQELAFRDICNWSDYLYDCELFWTNICISNYVQNMQQPFASHGFIDAYHSVSKFFSSNQQKQIAFLLTLDLYFDSNRTTNEITLFRLDSEWNKHLGTREVDEDEMNFLDFCDKMLVDKESQTLFFDAVKKMRCADCPGLLHKFNLMKKAFVEVFQAGKRNISYFIQLINQANTNCFMSTFITLNSLVMKNPLFVDLCTSEEVKSWESADSAWRTIMKSNQNFSCAASDFSLFLIEQFSPKAVTRKPTTFN